MIDDVYIGRIMKEQYIRGLRDALVMAKVPAGRYQTHLEGITAADIYDAISTLIDEVEDKREK